MIADLSLPSLVAGRLLPRESAKAAVPFRRPFLATSAKTPLTRSPSAPALSREGRGPPPADERHSPHNERRLALSPLVSLYGERQAFAFGRRRRGPSGPMPGEGAFFSRRPPRGAGSPDQRVDTLTPHLAAFGVHPLPRREPLRRTTSVRLREGSGAAPVATGP